MTTPTSHLEEALKLEADGLVDLWKVTLVGTDTPTILRFRNGPEVTWQGNLYESMACQLSGESEKASDERSRPTFSVMNPDNIFGPFADAGYLELAQVVRYRLLQQHLLANSNIFQQNTWIVGRVTSVSRQVISMELRRLTDQPQWHTPARSFMPPEYPFVVI
jgi:phage-related protein